MKLAHTKQFFEPAKFLREIQAGSSFYYDKIFKRIIKIKAQSPYRRVPNFAKFRRINNWLYWKHFLRARAVAPESEMQSQINSTDPLGLSSGEARCNVRPQMDALSAPSTSFDLSGSPDGTACTLDYLSKVQAVAHGIRFGWVVDGGDGVVTHLSHGNQPWSVRPPSGEPRQGPCAVEGCPV